MTKTEFYILNSLYNGSRGRASCASDIFGKKSLSLTDQFKMLIKKGYISSETKGITQNGLEALEPYRVNNAVILAAGASTRFIPLSLEQPKGLFEVKGEKLIERQIQQLLDAGISDITLVLGYKKEMFYYLADKYGVKYVINESFNIRNNIESLYLAKNELKNTYVCVSDSYFVENPFNQFEYQSFSAGITTFETTDEMYVDTDSDAQIISMEKNRGRGQIMLGHSFWNEAFSKSFISFVEADREIGKYSQCFWEWLVKDNLNNLPPFYFKEYEASNIFEFDYFEDLRKFDNQYLGYTHSEIIRNIKLVFRCDEEDIINFRNISKGMTNTSFIFQIHGVDYIYRHPGDGTDSIISRRNEKKSLIKAKEFGFDPTYIYADVNEGWKISVYIPEFREPNYSSFEDSKKIIDVMRKLHNTDIKVDYGMNPWEDSLETERLLLEKDPSCFDNYKGLKKKIEILYEKTKNDGVNKCFCHGDTYQPNWMIKPDGEVLLIDWEYAGYSDPGIDVGYYIVDAMYDFDDAEKFIKMYLKDDCSEGKFFHFMAYVAIIAYYWFVWALYRESCGAVMGESLENWKHMAEKYSSYLLEDKKEMIVE
ncbi:MAG: NTP transferase domain-containing protein [Oscillospiraceae bacterium]|nr:NTP transferase domain-containing protein [Oscillospiraceae bacterium]